MATDLVRDHGTESEDDILFFKEEDIRGSIEECERSLVRRILVDRSFSAGTMEAALGAIWGHPEGFRVLDHGDNIFQFFFAKEVDVLRVERGAPWLFKNFILNLKRWRDDIKIEEEDFSPLWVQLWGMPEKIGAVKEVAFFSMKDREARIVKIKVNLDVTKVLKDRLFLSVLWSIGS